MSRTQALIGVDWGTHSSKWTWALPESDSTEQIQGQFKILRSDVCLDSASNCILMSVEAPTTGSIYESGIKGRLIRDPDAAFWGGTRKRIRLTLGELVSFSLWSLLSEAYQNLRDNTGMDPDEVEVRFSLPNWVGSIAEAAVARTSYEQAARVACRIFVDDRQAWSRDPHPHREDWQERVRQALNELNISDEYEINEDTQGFESIIKSKTAIDESMTFRFVAESSAAGLTGLRNVETAIEGKRYLRKILVVDVGAGSTDIGYVLRTIPQATTGAKEALCQLPPADTCSVAGEELSRAIVEIYRGRGENIGLDEAERRKIIGQDKDWLTYPAVADWKRSIADHVRRYVADIPDMRWLPNEPGLKVVITGGSGVVAGLEEEILAAVKKGLEERQISPDIINTTELMRLTLEGPSASDVNRLAVVIGAASEELPMLSYYPKLDPPMYVPPVRPKPSWTG
jgi:hypothetical protein